MYNSPMTRVTATEARNQLPDLLERAHKAGERIVIARHGKPSAALISYSDLKRYQALEIAQDLSDLNRAKAENTGFITLEEYRAKRKARNS
jgi:prevent-host-death family protein